MTRQNILITGSVFNDLDKDRIKDSTEAGLSGWRVFIDKDNDGIQDGFNVDNVFVQLAGANHQWAIP